ncbi:cyclin-dependent kinase 4-like [Copidosoma floridanum]|uniref:cyclin-dependent kinase 4-like n=1 Tax=Copidosoma floridanum TaxID=29053 RepID=UPI0006C944C8|nr:cyclin-dependent kinase 4-like [Copidosoma floridanum]
MASRARPSSTDLPLPSAKRSKLSSSAATPSPAVAESSPSSCTSPDTTVVECTQVCDTASQQQQVEKTPGSLLLEASEELPASDESFGDDDAANKASSPGTTARTEGGVNQPQACEMGKEGVAPLACVSQISDNPPYHELSKIGDGAYGKVFRAKNRVNGQVVALKRVPVPVSREGMPPWIIREISTLRKLNEFQHPHVVRLLDVCQGNFMETISSDAGSKPLNGRLSMWLVFEHIEQDLASFISACKSRGGCSLDTVKHLSQEILMGVDFLHMQRVIHRDIKPQNLLVTRDGHIKIADFGLAKDYDFEMKLTSLVVTLWYRAPEVLLSCSYASPIDIWSVGCVIAELCEMRPLFPGTSETNQLDAIFKILGKPAREEWPDNVSLTWDAIPNRLPRPLEAVIANLDESGLDLIKQMLTFNPHKRVTASKALEHRFFDENKSS